MEVESKMIKELQNKLGEKFNVSVSQFEPLIYIKFYTSTTNKYYMVRQRISYIETFKDIDDYIYSLKKQIMFNIMEDVRDRIEYEMEDKKND